VEPDRETFRLKIEKALAELEDLKASTQESAKPVELDQTRLGRLSRMDAMQGQAMAKAAEERRGARVHALQKALQKIEAGEFGWCEECGKGIAKPRLLANPAVGLCIDCASQLESSPPR